VLVSGGGANPVASDGGRVQRQELFISYSRKDRAFLEQFWTHLKPLETLYGLQRWDDSRIKPGDVWLEEIKQALSRAQVALLLVSPDFLASDFIQRKELPSLFDAAKKDGLTILWLPIRPCSWKRYPQIERYQSVGSVNPTLAEMGEVERDRVMVQITDRIHDLFEQIGKERLAVQQAAKAEVMVLQQAEERASAEQEAKREAEETASLESLKPDNEARAEAERWKADAERLAREEEESQRQATFTMTRPSPQPEIPDPKRPPLIQISATRGWLVRKGNEWRKQEEAITVKGYREVLADDVAITMIQIPEGHFLRGLPPEGNDCSDGQGPQHRVTLRGFFMGQTPVTHAQWKAVADWPLQETDMDPYPSHFEGANKPVENVSWKKAIEFCRRLSKSSGRHYTLPSEAQWEYACRAGTTTPFAFGERLTPELANYDDNNSDDSGMKRIYRKETKNVASFPANDWGLYDMHGNVEEWCLDLWDKSYQGAPTDGSARTYGWSLLRTRVLRGGSWRSRSFSCRSDYRASNTFTPVDGCDYVGFRVCCLPQD
jgi:formylglycine-generating enzyme required for sulfatase activity